MNFNVVDVDGFGKNLEKVARKYPSSVDLVEALFAKLEEAESIEDLDLAGNHLQRYKLKGNRVYKTRIENPDANKGVRGGFRIIWFLVAENKEIYPLTIYSKSDQEDIPSKEVLRLIRRYTPIHI